MDGVDASVETRARLGDILVKKGTITIEQRDQALAHSREHGMRLGEALVDLEFIANDHIYWALENQFDVRLVEIQPDMIDHELVRRFPAGILRLHSLFPLIEIGDEIVVLSPNPGSSEGLSALQSHCSDRKFTIQLGEKTQIEGALDVVFPLAGDTAWPDRAVALDCAPDADPPETIVSLDGVRWLLSRAIDARGDLLLARRGGQAVAVVVTSEGEEAVGDLRGHDFDRLYDLIMRVRSDPDAVLWGEWIWPEQYGRNGATYVVSVARFATLGALGLRLRPMELIGGATEAVSADELPEASRVAIASAASDGRGRLTLIAAAPSVDWEPALRHYLGSLCQSLAHVLFVSSVSRFAMSEVFQYPGGPETSPGRLPALVDHTMPSHIVIDTPLDFDDYLAIRGGRPTGPGLTALYRVGRKGRGGGLPSSFRGLLEADSEAIVLLILEDRIERLDTEQALAVLRNEEDTDGSC